MTRTCADEDLNFFAGGGGGGPTECFPGGGGVLSLNYFQFYHVNFMKLIFFQAGKKSEPPLDQHMHIIDLYRYA